MKALLVLATTAIALSAGAAPDRSAPPLPPVHWGLWENSVMGMPGMEDRPDVTRSCISVATWMGFMDTHGDDSRHCIWSNRVATADTYAATMSCLSGKIVGHAEMKVDSPESFHYTMSFDMAQSTAKTSHFDVTATAKFVSTSCRGLKPGEDIYVWE